ncbi:hypothetical protein ACA910_012281 [Epithemia clementina (nom. ined.)]
MVRIKNSFQCKDCTRYPLVIIGICVFIFYQQSAWLQNNASEVSSLLLLSSHNTLASSPAKTRTTPNGKTNALIESQVSDWPGIPVEELGHPLVKKGSSFVQNARALFLEYIDEFLEAYNSRPDKVNLCGIRINHAFALFLTIKALKPKSIIESGVNAGVSTYIMRQAAGVDTRIFAIDPLDRPICKQKERWIDTQNSVYYTGEKNFKDIGEIDWTGMIKKGEIDPDTTLVFLDDHLAVFDRLPVLLKNGFKHVILEDKYKTREGATKGDKAGWTPKQMFARIDGDTKFLWHNTATYNEWPPMVPPSTCKNAALTRKNAGGFMHPNDTNVDIVEPILRPDKDPKDRKLYEKICKMLGIDDPDLKDQNNYMQVMNYNQIAYFELVPMSPHLRGFNWS